MDSPRGSPRTRAPTRPYAKRVQARRDTDSVCCRTDRPSRFGQQARTHRLPLAVRLHRRSSRQRDCQRYSYPTRTGLASSHPVEKKSSAIRSAYKLRSYTNAWSVPVYPNRSGIAWESQCKNPPCPEGATVLPASVPVAPGVPASII